MGKLKIVEQEEIVKTELRNLNTGDIFKINGQIGVKTNIENIEVKAILLDGSDYWDTDDFSVELLRKGTQLIVT